MSQTVVLEQSETVAPQSITLKFADHSSNENPNPTPTIDSKTLNLDTNNTDSKPDPEDQSTTIKSNDPESSHTVPIPNVDPQIEAAVNEFIRKHGSSEEEEVRTEAMNELRSFIEREEIETSTLLVLVKFASEINNAELLEVFCQRVADVIKDKSVEERTSSLGTPSPWMPTQSPHPLSYGPAMPSGPYMGQVTPSMQPPYRPQTAGGFGPFITSEQQSGSSFSTSGGNPFG